MTQLRATRPRRAAQRPPKGLPDIGHAPRQQRSARLGRRCRASEPGPAAIRRGHHKLLLNKAPAEMARGDAHSRTHARWAVRTESAGVWPAASQPSFGLSRAWRQAVQSWRRFGSRGRRSWGAGRDGQSRGPRCRATAHTRGRIELCLALHDNFCYLARYATAAHVSWAAAVRFLDITWRLADVMSRLRPGLGQQSLV